MFITLIIGSWDAMQSITAFLVAKKCITGDTLYTDLIKLTDLEKITWLRSQIITWQSTGPKCKVFNTQSGKQLIIQVEQKAISQPNEHILLEASKTTFCLLDTVKPVCNDRLYNKIYYLWFIQ